MKPSGSDLNFGTNLTLVRMHPCFHTNAPHYVSCAATPLTCAQISNPLFEELWSPDISFLSMIPSTPKPTGDDWKRSARRLEIFLDLLLALSASLTSHILDDRFLDVRIPLCHPPLHIVFVWLELTLRSGPEPRGDGDAFGAPPPAGADAE